ncbi:MAG TPA: hypothetical protein VEJ18_14135 [Planctomycetota bacterium]|nr:hypothetical protein [Planctomycetota bacterium]
MNIIRKLLIAGIILSLVVAAGGWIVTTAIISSAKEVWPLFPHDPSIVDAMRSDYRGSKETKKVLELYGTPLEETWKVVFVPKSELKRPKENESIVYYELKTDERPWQAKNFEFGRKYAVGGGIIGAVVCLLGLLLVKAASPAKGGRSAAAE